MKRNGNPHHLLVCNEGQLITHTNYWETENAKQGVLFFTVNAGCVRLLLPKRMPPGKELDDSVLDTVQYVIISRGKLCNLESYEVLFEDGTSCPYVIFTLANQWDRLLPFEDAGRTDLAFHVYKDGSLIRQLDARYRIVATIPCLEPWA